MVGEYEKIINSVIDAMPDMIQKQKPDLWVSSEVYHGLLNELKTISLESYKGHKIVVRFLTGKRVVSTNNIE